MSEKQTPPHTDNVLKAMEVAGLGPMAASYLETQYKKKIPPKQLSAYESVLVALHDFAKTVQNKFNSISDVWSGTPRKSDFQTLQTNDALQAMAELKANTKKPVVLNFIIGSGSKYLRAYSGGITPDSSAEKGMDKAINAFFADHNIVTGNEGILYQCDDNGEIKYDNGQPVLIDKETALSLMNDEKEGLNVYLAKLGFDAGFELHQLTAEEKQVVTAVKDETKKVEAIITEEAPIEVVREPEEEIIPVTDQPTGVSGGRSK